MFMLCYVRGQRTVLLPACSTTSEKLCTYEEGKKLHPFKQVDRVYICAYVPIFAVRTYDNNNSRLNERVSVCSCRRTGTNIHYQNCVDDSIFIVCDNCRRPFQVSRRKESMSESMSELSYNWFSSIL